MIGSVSSSGSFSVNLYQDYTTLSIRNYDTSHNEAMLAELLTNNIVRLAGLPASQAAFTGFSIVRMRAALRRRRGSMMPILAR